MLATGLMVALGGHTEAAEWRLYLLAFGALAPPALIAGPRLGRALIRAQGEHGVTALAVLLCASLAVFVLAARVVDAAAPGRAGASAIVAVCAGLWGVLAASLVARALRGGPLALRATLLVERPSAAWTLAGGLAAAGTLPFLGAGLLRPGPFAASLLVGAALAAAVLVAARVRLGPRTGLFLDVVVVALVLGAVVDVTGYLTYLPFDPATTDRSPLSSSLLGLSSQVHLDFYLGPVNDVLHGRAMLVDTFSQYGVGVFYFLGAFFEVAPLGYGPLGLLVGVLAAGQYAVSYAVLRLAGTARTVAAIALAAAIAASVFVPLGTITSYPSTGALRFGAAYLIVLLGVLGARWPERAGWARGATLATLAVSSIWSIETFVYATVTFAAVAALAAATAGGSPRERWRRLVSDLALALGVSLAANVALALATRAASGSWPDYEPYIHFFTTYAVKGFGQVLFHPWSPAIAVGAAYFASAVGLVTLLARRPDVSRERRVAVVATGGLTAFGAVSLSYLMNNSHPNTLTLVALPTILIGALWLTLLSSWRPRASGAARVATVAVAAWLAGLLLVGGWPDTSEKWSRTLLAQALPGGDGLRASLDELWSSPPFDPRVTEAEGLLARHAPGSGPALVLVDPEHEAVLERLAHRQGVDPSRADERLHWPRVARAVDRLAPGTVLIEQPVGAGFHPLKLRALQRIRSRFDLQVLERRPSGLVAFRLVTRSPARGP